MKSADLIIGDRFRITGKAHKSKEVFEVARHHGDSVACWEISDLKYVEDLRSVWCFDDDNFAAYSERGQIEIVRPIGALNTEAQT